MSDNPADGQVVAQRSLSVTCVTASQGDDVPQRVSALYPKPVSQLWRKALIAALCSVMNVEAPSSADSSIHAMAAVVYYFAVASEM